MAERVQPGQQALALVPTKGEHALLCVMGVVFMKAVCPRVMNLQQTASNAEASSVSFVHTC